MLCKASLTVNGKRKPKDKVYTNKLIN